MGGQILVLDHSQSNDLIWFKFLHQMQRLTDREEGQGEDRLEGLPGSKMDSFSKYLFPEHFLVLGDVTQTRLTQREN